MVSVVKFLVTWKLLLRRGDTKRLAQQPKLLTPGFSYVKELIRSNKVISLYTILPKKTTRRRLRHVWRRPSGFAIVEAKSIEEVKKIVEAVPGLTHEGVPGSQYLKCEIVPVKEIGLE